MTGGTLRGTSAFKNRGRGQKPSRPFSCLLRVQIRISSCYRTGTALDGEPLGLVDQTGVSDRFSTRYRWAIRNEPAA